MTALRPLTAALLILSLAGLAAGQDRAPASRNPQPTAPAAAPKPPPTPVELSDDVFRLNSVGLSMHLPVGVISQISGSGDQMAAQIMAEGVWLVNIQTPASRNTKATPESVAEEVRDQLLAAAGVPDRTIAPDGTIRNKGTGEKLAETRARVLEDVKAVRLATPRPDEARPAARFYVWLPPLDKEPAIVRGYTIFMVAPGRFVTFDLVTPETNFQTAKVAYETMIATARFADPATVAATRGAAVETGIAFLNSLTPADYERAIASLNDQWYRRYKPAPGGADADATEVAYRRVRAWKGRRGELDPSRPPSRWAVVDRQEGYLVRIDARFLESDKIIDSVGFYFMSLDRKEEAWNLQMVIHDPATRRPVLWRELGARNGDSMHVVTEGSGESKTSQPTVPPQGYLNQVESFLLPGLLIGARKPDDKGHAGEYGFYTYQSEFGRIRLRTDKLGNAQDRAGAWTLETKMNEDRDPQTAIYNERGDLIRITLPDTSVWVPTTLQRLADLWRTKGLPMETPEYGSRRR